MSWNLLRYTSALLWLWPSGEACGPHLPPPACSDPPARSTPRPGARPAPRGDGTAHTATRTSCWRSEKMEAHKRLVNLQGWQQNPVRKGAGWSSLLCPLPQEAALWRCCRRSSWAARSATGSRWDNGPPLSLHGQPSLPRPSDAGQCDLWLEAQRLEAIMTVRIQYVKVL